MYLTPLQWRTRTVMPSADVDALDVGEPGFLGSRIAFQQGKIEARLAKRYATPFASPVPEIVLGWLTDLVTFDAYMKRGFNPAAEQDSEIKAAATTALEEVKEAAESKEGLFELPLREDMKGSSAIDRGGSFGYSEASPYAWTDRQREEVRR